MYRLATPVPENWIPFTPVAKAPITSPAYDVQLERRTMLRFHEDESTSEVHPKGILLRTDLSQDVETEPPLRLEEEEVPRAGAIVTRSFQFARWLGGRGYLWVGRAKRTGRGEGSSGLRYDTSDPG